MSNSHNKNSLFFNGHYFYKLACPFRVAPYYPFYPLDVKTIAKTLKVSERTALRVCKGERELSHAELHLLQCKTFGYIDDANFCRFKFYIKNGSLFSYELHNFELKASEITEFYLLRLHYHQALDELKATKKRLHELENPQPKQPTNILNFADYKR